jgi:hypothetical protein
MPNSPPVYRRATSREDTAGDVFSRLGAGLQDPAPGGNIREFNGKVGCVCVWGFKDRTHDLISLFFAIKDESWITFALYACR